MTEQPKRGWLGILLENYSFFLSALYLFATAIGLIYSGVLYGNFGINIFDYSEISDFLLVAFKNPAVFLPTGIATIVSLVVVGVNESSYRRYQRRRPDNELSETPSELEQADYSVSRQRRRAIIISLLIALAGFLPTLVAPIYYAHRMAGSIKDGEEPAVELRYRSFQGSAGQITVSGLELIGATQKATFFYDENAKRTIVVPQAQIVSIEVPE